MPDQKQATREAILKRALEQPSLTNRPKKTLRPQTAKKYWKPYLKKRPNIEQVVLRLPDTVRADLVKWLEKETSAHHTFNSFAIWATEELLANPPKTIPDRSVSPAEMSNKKGFTVRWSKALVDDTDVLTSKYGGPRKGMSRNTVILFAIERKLQHP